MKLRRKLAAVAAGTSLLAAVPLVMAGSALAAAPPWEPDPNSLGTIAFYDASGNVLTGGSNLSHLADYYAVSTARSSTSAFKATLYFAAPDHTKVTNLWFVQQESASTVFPNASAPPPLTGPGFANPLVTAGPNDGNLTDFLAVATLDSTAGYADTVQIRVKDNTSGTKYWASDISYNSVTGAWSQVYPVVSVPTPTTTTLAVTPASPQPQGTTLTLQATVSPSSAAGSVQFFDGATSLGSASVSGGTAQITNSSLAAGTHSLTAKFVSASPTLFAGSTSTATSYTITSAGSTTVQDTSPSVGFDGWAGVVDAAANGGTYRTDATAGAKATFKFSGKQLTWVTRKGPDQGIASVSIDGASKGNVDLYAATAQGFFQPYTGLTGVTHTIVITVSGTKNVASTGASVAVDAFVVGAATTQDSSTKVTYDTWKGVTATAASAGTYRISGTKNATAVLSFSGTAVTWVTTTGPTYGMASVSIDGVNKGTVDLYTASVHWQAMQSYAGLVSGSHTIVVTVLGTKNASSKGTNVVVDAFVVHS